MPILANVFLVDCLPVAPVAAVIPAPVKAWCRPNGTRVGRASIVAVVTITVAIAIAVFAVAIAVAIVAIAIVAIAVIAIAVGAVVVITVSVIARRVVVDRGCHVPDNGRPRIIAGAAIIIWTSTTDTEKEMAASQYRACRQKKEAEKFKFHEDVLALTKATSVPFYAAYKPFVFIGL